MELIVIGNRRDYYDLDDYRRKNKKNKKKKATIYNRR